MPTIKFFHRFARSLITLSEFFLIMSIKTPSLTQSSYLITILYCCWCYVDFVTPKDPLPYETLCVNALYAITSASLVRMKTMDIEAKGLFDIRLTGVVSIVSILV